MQPRIPTLSDEQAPAAARTILEQIQRAVGMVPNLHRTLAHAPAALRGYVGTASALAGGVLDAALREQIAIATAGVNSCEYCASAHTALGQAAGVEADELSRNLKGRATDPRTEEALTFARRLVETRGNVGDDEVRRLREAGYDDAQIVEIVAHVGVNWFTNVFNNFARTEIDFPVVSLAE